jgi:hypothetical protein
MKRIRDRVRLNEFLFGRTHPLRVNGSLQDPGMRFAVEVLHGTVVETPSFVMWQVDESNRAQPWLIWVNYHF